MLGLSEPWQVEDVKLDLAGKKVEVRVAVRRRAADRQYHRADCRPAAAQRAAAGVWRTIWRVQYASWPGSTATGRKTAGSSSTAMISG